MIQYQLILICVSLNIYKMIRVIFNQKRFFADLGKRLKPQEIDSTFNLNKQTIEKASIQTKSQQVKILKVKRPNVSQILKKKKMSEIEKQQIQKQYHESVQANIEQNLKTKNYHINQYFKGEHLIQNVPLNPYYQYKLEDFKRKYLKKQEELKSFVQPYIDLQKRALIKEETAHAYHEKQTKYEMEQFAKYLQEYPGSPKGPKPEDDLDHYLAYAQKRIPQIFMNKLKIDSSLEQLKIRARNEGEMFESVKFASSAHTSDIFSSRRDYDEESISKHKWSDVFSSTQHVPIVQSYSEVPSIPETQFKNYHQHIGQLTNWNNFVNHYKEKHGMDKLKIQIQMINKIYKENDEDPQNQFYQLKPTIPSLYRYYKTLPQQVQNHPGLKDVYLGLQYKSPDWSYQEKQDALNYAATLVQPLDKLSHKAMQEFVSNGKFRLTPFFVDKCYTINPEFTFDIKQFLNQIKQEQLRGQSMIKQAQEKYPQPPPVHLQWEQGTANLPVDFYDNDDGFWDSIISTKLKRYDQAKPMLKIRKHFLH